MNLTIKFICIFLLNYLAFESRLLSVSEFHVPNLYSSKRHKWCLCRAFEREMLAGETPNCQANSVSHNTHPVQWSLWLPLYFASTLKPHTSLYLSDSLVFVCLQLSASKIRLSSTEFHCECADLKKKKKKLSSELRISEERISSNWRIFFFSPPTCNGNICIFFLVYILTNVNIHEIKKMMKICVSHFLSLSTMHTRDSSCTL